MVRLINEADIRRISENVSRRILNEGYSSSHFKAQINKKLPRVLKWLDVARNSPYIIKQDGTVDVKSNPNFVLRDNFYINLRPFVENEDELPLEFKEDAVVLIEYGYVPNLDLPLKVIGRHYENNMARIQIVVSDEAMANHIKAVSLHELTHAVDEMIDRIKEPEKQKVRKLTQLKNEK